MDVIDIGEFDQSTYKAPTSPSSPWSPAGLCKVVLPEARTIAASGGLARAIPLIDHPPVPPVPPQML